MKKYLIIVAPVHREHPVYKYMDDADGDGVVCD